MMPCVFVIGASGAGKSTLLRNAKRSEVVIGRPVLLLPKETTRLTRGEAELAECRHVSHEDFQARLATNQYRLHYSVFGEHYGLPCSGFESSDSDAIRMQTVPTNVARQLKADLRPEWDVAVCLLDTPIGVLRERLLRRGDPGTLATIEQRLSGASRNRAAIADTVITGGRTEDEEARDFQDWLIERFS